MSAEDLARSLKRAREGDRGAQELLIEEIRRLSRAACGSQNRVLRDLGLDWEDVAQESSRRFFEIGIHRYRGDGSVASYLYVVVKSALLQLLRKERRRQGREDVVAAQTPRSQEPSSTGLVVDSILKSLESECRRLIMRIFFDGTTYSEMSGELGITESSVRSKLSRCLRKAREYGM